MIDIHIPTRSTTLAAALSTLGFPVRPRQVHDDKSGDKDTTWQIGGGSLVMPVCNLGQLLEALHKKDLERNDPTHPLLDGIRALRNRERMLAHLLDGKPLGLVRDIHCDRTNYVNSPQAPPPASLGRSVTRDFRFLCAAGILGFGLVSWKGQAPNHEFTITEKSLFPGMLLASVLFRKLNDGTLEKDQPEHPLHYAMLTLRNHSRLVAALRDGEDREIILLRKPHSERRAWIEKGASDHAFDRVHRFFKI